MVCPWKYVDPWLCETQCYNTLSSLEASNVGGVAVSGLEMAQNSQRLQWSSEQVDHRLNDIMTEVYNICVDAGSKWSNDDPKLSGKVMPSLLAGANVAGFIKVADAMRAHGDWW